MPVVVQQPVVAPMPVVVQHPVVAPMPVVVQQPVVAPMPVVVQHPVAAAQQGTWIDLHYIPALEELNDVNGQQFIDVSRYYKFQTGGTMKSYDAFPQRVKKEWGRRMKAQFSPLNGGLFGS